MQATLASNLELFRAQEAKKKECQDLKEELEMKNAQIASFEEARKKDEGDKYFCLQFFNTPPFCMLPTILSRTFLCRTVKHCTRCPSELH